MNYERFNNNKNIYLIDMSKEKQPRLSEMVLGGIKKYLKQKKRILLLLNKRGHSAGMICTSCGKIPQCTHCDVPVAYHNHLNHMIGLCHICHRQYDVPRSCHSCQKETLTPYGLGIQKCADLIKSIFGIEPLILENTKINSLTKITKREKDISDARVIVSTGLLVQPPRGVEIDVVVHVDADIGLTIPNYSVNEKNFWYLYETFTKYSPRAFLVQTFNPEQRSIRQACHLNYEGFWEEEMIFRTEHGYPPAGDLCVILYKHEVEERMYKKISTLYQELLFLKEKYKVDVTLYTTPPLIYKMFGKYRYNIVLQGKELRNYMDIVFTRLQLTKRGFKIDREAKSLV